MSIAITFSGMLGDRPTVSDLFRRPERENRPPYMVSSVGDVLVGLLGLVGFLGSSFGTTMDVSGSRMRVVKPQGTASQEGYRGRWKSPQRDQYHAGKIRHGKSPMTRSKPLGPSSTSGRKHQREYGH